MWLEITQVDHSGRISRLHTVVQEHQPRRSRQEEQVLAQETEEMV